MSRRQKEWETYYHEVVSPLSPSDKAAFNRRLRSKVQLYEKLFEEDCKVALPGFHTDAKQT